MARVTKTKQNKNLKYNIVNLLKYLLHTFNKTCNSAAYTATYNSLKCNTFFSEKKIHKCSKIQ